MEEKKCDYMKQALEKLSVSLQTLQKEAPEYNKAFFEFVEQAEKEGALSVKTKELISIALGITAHCTHCIAFHVKNAIEAGASRQEILEAGLVAGLMGGGPAVAYLQYVFDACDQFGAK
ncbi:MAG: carboxymuconolactone decarboxylase family protein [candidate division WOR-3 bacterium]|nr:carboxymuconolactone decarboxylase family protein [candidate division WOR-3 bacterium]